MSKLYKVLKGGKSCNGGILEWALPKKDTDGTWQPGAWMAEIEGDLKACRKGYHLCRSSDLIHWLNEEIYEAEYEGEMVESNNKIVVRKCRLLKKCEGWTEKTTRLFACWCVRHTPLHDGRTVWDLLTDDRSKKAVEVAERYARGEATKKELTAAADAARDAAWDAAADAARDTARDTAAYAARDDAAYAAADTAAYAARDTARDTAAYTAAYAAADTAAYAARDAQTKELLRILEGGTIQ